MREEQTQPLTANELNHFTGTSCYYRITPKHILTEGAKYLADRAACYWLFDAIASHLCEIGTSDWFVLVRMVVSGSRATMIYEDGNGNQHASQEISYTDFPLPEITIYACFDSEHWVLMLPSEY